MRSSRSDLTSTSSSSSPTTLTASARKSVLFLDPYRLFEGLPHSSHPRSPFSEGQHLILLFESLFGFIHGSFFAQTGLRWVGWHIFRAMLLLQWGLVIRFFSAIFLSAAFFIWIFFLFALLSASSNSFFLRVFSASVFCGAIFCNFR